MTAISSNWRGPSDRHAEFVADFVPLTFVGNHDVTRIASKLTDPRHLGHALVVLFTLPGVPSVYYGDEQGFVGVKEDREGGDDAVRQAFPAGPDELATDGWPIYRLHQRLIGLRRREAWLTSASIEVVMKTNEQLQVRLGGADGQAIVALLNVADDAFTFAGAGPGELLLGSENDAPDGTGAPDVTVSAHGWVIVRPG